MDANGTDKPKLLLECQCGRQHDIGPTIKALITVSRLPATRPKRMRKPYPAEVRAYIIEKKYSVDFAAWWNFYESNGWKVGKNPMTDWKAAVRTWHYGDKKRGGGRPV